MRYFKFVLIFIPLIFASAAPSDVTLPLCSQAVHDSYSRIGPDGHTYLTWHPQIDAEHGCRFDHEHGSNPALASAGVDWQAGSFGPLYGYSAGLMGMPEGHAGFKGYAFRHGGLTWYILQHQGTARADIAACVQMHTLDIAAWDTAGAQVLDEHLMADFGPSVDNVSGDYLTPPGCPNQGSVTSTGVRMLPVGVSSVGYEPWRADVVTGTLDTRLSFNTKNPQTACDTISCTVALPRTDIGGPARGTFRTLTIEWLRLNSVDLGAATCEPYGADYWYDCTGAAWDEQPYRLNPLITGAN